MTPSGWIRSSSSLLGGETGEQRTGGVRRRREEKGYVMPGADFPL